MKLKNGFTLVELIIVISLLGILSVTVAPKFIGIQNDAIKATMLSTKAALLSEVQMINAKAEINLNPISSGSDAFRKAYAGYLNLFGRKIYVTNKDTSYAYNPAFNVGFAGKNANKDIVSLLKSIMHIDLSAYGSSPTNKTDLLLDQYGSDGFNIYSYKGINNNCVIHYSENSPEPVTADVSGC